MTGVALVRLREPPARAMVAPSRRAGATPRLAAEETTRVPPRTSTPPVKVLAPARVRVPVP